MNRRTYLASLVTGSGALGGGIALADLRPGRYRFLLVGTSPYLATEFQVLDGE
ncbi:hypothetical protein [Halorussus ruber]|uniref:hypothetical protein n=1 Tax=Halorussus ruber TaxID=1126238 RepID=UPI00143D92BA|nr:hypothetical protein [Halorussus ruber]